jgi:hypothetical protein
VSYAILIVDPNEEGKPIVGAKLPDGRWYDPADGQVKSPPFFEHEEKGIDLDEFDMTSFEVGSGPDLDDLGRVFARGMRSFWYVSLGSDMYNILCCKTDWPGDHDNNAREAIGFLVRELTDAGD